MEQYKILLLKSLQGNYPEFPSINWINKRLEPNKISLRQGIEKHTKLNKNSTWLAFRPSPIKKLSGFISRWRKPLECMYSTLLIWKL